MTPGFGMTTVTGKCIKSRAEKLSAHTYRLGLQGSPSAAGGAERQSVTTAGGARSWRTGRNWKLLRRTKCFTMKLACLLILASLALCYLTVSHGQGISAEDEADRGNTIDDIILQRAESLLLRSILKKLQDGNGPNDGLFSQPEWVTKRQHPGKRFNEDVEKRQHPGRREEEEEEDEQFLDVQRRQHPGKREDEMRAFVTGLQKRQHPGKRAAAGGHLSDSPLSLLSELSKRQHPGKRYLLHSKRQHPGKRYFEDEEGDSDRNAGADEDLSEFEKRQHPGKRLWDNGSPELSTGSPCDVLDPDSCSKTSLLLDFLDNIKSHAEEKRQHPGKRFAPEEDLEDGE